VSITDFSERVLILQTAVAEVEMNEVENDVHEVLNANRPHAVHIRVERPRKRRRRDLTTCARQQVCSTTGRDVRKRTPVCEHARNIFLFTVKW